MLKIDRIKIKDLILILAKLLLVLNNPKEKSLKNKEILDLKFNQNYYNKLSI